ncbi:MAG: mannonate dehydratase [Rhizobiaceae bacterium]
MIESWRWYGPLDKISLEEVAQTRASGIVTALHEVAYGEVWSLDDIQDRQYLIAADLGLGLHWNVVESLPIHEDIKLGAGNLDNLFANYRRSLRNLAEAGVYTVCYNFMPVLDWTRTHLSAPVPRGGTALRYSVPHMAAFETCILKRAGAEDDYSAEVIKAGEEWFAASTQEDQDSLLASIMAGLPGAFTRYSVEGLRTALKAYQGMKADDLRANYARFLGEIIPTADELGIRMCVHPDDPPRNILGLPRIVSNEEDIAWILQQQDCIANGLTLCSGSLGANPANNVPEIATRFATRIHFAHLRNVSKEEDGSFQEAAHLAGDTDMVALIKVLLAEENCRTLEGRDDVQIPFRPDHGHILLDDFNRDAHPGYSLIGRMCGLLELRGVIATLGV